MSNRYLHKAFPDIIGPEDDYAGLNFLLGTRPYSNLSFVSAVGADSKRVAYGMNRADFAFIAGGIVPGVLILKPDFPENPGELAVPVGRERIRHLPGRELPVSRERRQGPVGEVAHPPG